MHQSCDQRDQEERGRCGQAGPGARDEAGDQRQQQHESDNADARRDGQRERDENRGAERDVAQLLQRRSSRRAAGPSDPGLSEGWPAARDGSAAVPRPVAGVLCADRFPVLGGRLRFSRLLPLAGCTSPARAGSAEAPHRSTGVSPLFDSPGRLRKARAPRCRPSAPQTCIAPVPGPSGAASGYCPAPRPVPGLFARSGHRFPDLAAADAPPG